MSFWALIYILQKVIYSSPPCFITLLFTAGEEFFFFLKKNIFIRGKANSRLHRSGKLRTGALP